MRDGLQDCALCAMQMVVGGRQAWYVPIAGAMALQKRSRWQETTRQMLTHCWWRLRRCYSHLLRQRIA